MITKKLCMILLLSMPTINHAYKGVQEKVIRTSIPVSRYEKKNLVAITSPRKEPEHTVTIWVHGTGMNVISRHFHVRKKGFTRAIAQAENTHPKKMARYLSASDPARFPLESFYFWGWSGKLRFSARRKAAHALYKDLEKFSAEYEKKHGIKPRIRLLTHSHGNNTVLNLPLAKKPGDTLVIDEVIFLAGPVQEATANFVKDPLFKKVYNIYSRSDLYQILDAQGIYPFKETGLSKRKPGHKRYFFSQRRYKPSPNLIQGFVRFNGRSISHVEFLLRKLLKVLPRMLNALDEYWEKQQVGLASIDTLYSLRVNFR